MNYEILGTIASIFVLISFLMKGERNIRLINIIGAFIFIIYGILINAFSIWFLNGVLLIIHIIKLIKRIDKNGRKTKKSN